MHITVTLTMRQILDDFASQLAHLRKELLQIQSELNEWEDSSRSGVNGTSTAR